jgi:preprotein translocase subunit SecG
MKRRGGGIVVVVVVVVAVVAVFVHVVVGRGGGGGKGDFGGVGRRGRGKITKGKWNSEINREEKRVKK